MSQYTDNLLRSTTSAASIAKDLYQRCVRESNYKLDQAVPDALLNIHRCIYKNLLNTPGLSLDKGNINGHMGYKMAAANIILFVSEGGSGSITQAQRSHIIQGLNKVCLPDDQTEIAQLPEITPGRFSVTTPISPIKKNLPPVKEEEKKEEAKDVAATAPVVLEDSALFTELRNVSAASEREKQEQLIAYLGAFLVTYKILTQNAPKPSFLAWRTPADELLTHKGYNPLPRFPLSVTQITSDQSLCASLSQVISTKLNSRACIAWDITKKLLAGIDIRTLITKSLTSNDSISRADIKYFDCYNEQAIKEMSAYIMLDVKCFQDLHTSTRIAVSSTSTVQQQEEDITLFNRLIRGSAPTAPENERVETEAFVSAYIAVYRIIYDAETVSWRGRKESDLLYNFFSSLNTNVKISKNGTCLTQMQEYVFPNVSVEGQNIYPRAQAAWQITKKFIVQNQHIEFAVDHDYIRNLADGALRQIKAFVLFETTPYQKQYQSKTVPKAPGVDLGEEKNDASGQVPYRMRRSHAGKT